MMIGVLLDIDRVTSAMRKRNTVEFRLNFFLNGRPEALNGESDRQQSPGGLAERLK